MPKTTKTAQQRTDAYEVLRDAVTRIGEAADAGGHLAAILARNEEYLPDHTQAVVDAMFDQLVAELEQAVEQVIIAWREFVLADSAAVLHDGAESWLAEAAADAENERHALFASARLITERGSAAYGTEWQTREARDAHWARGSAQAEAA